ncbi:thrombospondin type 3 repeat-containing protein [Pseudenhygromyxa sp. WMMC2535]|uniref:thrombospondin type 3 repeat-containing protein n=1 Tax=Pseudenhygromyxa sp. WMMC2535 TaxID=2712867 RepID=UPI00155670F2|nr:thrombospondin type 3 repeat-containing protein [Pseudenhygromyxa sp. WMMC2535]NVB36859.1 thrombospondin type 3 repeat-containing protein [Pseudenhygromyxa sp. WMMC2535]
MQILIDRTSPLLFLPLATLVACVLPDKSIGDDPVSDGTGTTSTDSGDADSDDADSDSDSGDTDSDSSATNSTDSADDGDPCFGPDLSPAQDEDCDDVALACDNATSHFNPSQLDQDGDELGDVADLCPLLHDGIYASTTDQDGDGIGDACDRCPFEPEHYRVDTIEDPRLWVRNTPWTGDADQDGVGDVCDNCVAVANCQGYDADNPPEHGTLADDGTGQDCQQDADGDGIGDACEGSTLPGAAGPVGFAGSDDFDQDGLSNLEDLCPRIPVAALACASDEDCPDATSCTAAGVCNHADRDSDFVGDVCDTCPGSANPMQVAAAGMAIDDADGDFVGAACETNSACAERSDPAPIGFYDVAVDGRCCVTLYPGDGELHTPLGVPVVRECSEADEQQGLCTSLTGPTLATPGAVELPPGCEQALADAGVDAATALTLTDVGDDPLALWSHACLLPQHDQDFDGVGDACDLCMFAFDPSNTIYVDEQAMAWPNAGAACNGAFSPTLVRGAACWSE